MEILSDYLLPGAVSNVSTLPIRNGNSQRPGRSEQKYSGKYLTYKEWKLVSTKVGVLCPHYVSTLPIRNGNMSSITTVIFSIFSSRKYLTYKEWKLSLTYVAAWLKLIVSTLPIRNGNKT